MIQAQFRLNNIILDKGTFYFQWVHTGSEAKRDPRKPIQKMLYLIFVKDLTCWDDDLQRRSFGLNNRMTFFKDSLSSHFYRMVLEHHELGMTEANHTALCACKV